MIFEMREYDTPDGRRKAWFAYPEGEYDYHVKSDSVTVLLDDADEEKAKAFLELTGWQWLVDERKSIIAFPIPENGKWATDGRPEKTNDEKFLSAFQPTVFSGKISNGWKAIADVHYLVGIGSGATIANTLCAMYPDQDLAAAVLLVGGEMKEGAVVHGTYAGMPAMILGGDAYAPYYVRANKADEIGEGKYECAYNKNMFVETYPETELTKEAADHFFDRFITKVRRANTDPAGDPDRRIEPEKEGFIYMKDVVLGDNGGLRHSWIEYVPTCVKEDPSKKVPLILLSHGAGDSSLRMAEQSKFHEVAEKYGFICIYAYASNLVSWNLTFKEGAYDDTEYYVELIKYLKNKYAIDDERIYTSGFSNGAGFAMLFAMMHPEIIAASCPIDSTFPYATMAKFKPAGAPPYLTLVPKEGEVAPPAFKPSSDAEKGLAPLKRALEAQKTKRYELPVMYFYGTRESEYPIGAGSNQELSYGFWKEFNGIESLPTDDDLDPAVGVRGMDVRTFYPDSRYPYHAYIENVFYADKENKKKDYYHFMLMVGKAHEVHPIEPWLGWKFVYRFRRLADGSLVDSEL